MKVSGFALPVLAASAQARILGVAEGTHNRVIQFRGVENSTSWPYGPFSTKGRDIVNSRGDVITWAGVNWPMSGNPSPTPSSDSTE